MANRYSIETVFKAIDNMTAPVSRMQNSVRKFTRSVDRGLRNANRSVDKINHSLSSGLKTAAAFTATAVLSVGGAIGVLVREASKIENAVAAFQPLLGSVEKAEIAVQALNDTAASTPFQFETLASSMNQLLPVMNGDIENTIKTIRMLGDTAGGNAQKLDSITRGFTKAMLKGKVDMESLNMIAEAGVPIFGDLASVMGTEVNESFFKMISAGKVTTSQLTQAFEKMTSSGGMFFNGMSIASKTQSGLFSTMKDNVSLTAAEIGKTLLPVTKDLTKTVIDLTGVMRSWVIANKDIIALKVQDTVKFITDNAGNFFTIAKGLVQVLAGWLAITIALKVATLAFNLTMIAANVVMFAWSVSTKALAISMGIFKGVLAAVRMGVLLFNAALYANPIGLIVGLIGGLIAAGVLLYKNWDKVSGFMGGVWDKIKESAKSGIDFVLKILDKVVAPFRMIFSGFAKIKSSAAAIFGGDSGEENSEGSENVLGGGSRQVVTGAEQVAKSIEERSSTTRNEVVIRDDTGRAETQSPLPNGVSLMPSGAF